MWSAGLTFGNLAKVAGGEPDPVAVHVERHLPAVGARTERAFGHLGQTKVAEDLGRLRWVEELRETEGGAVCGCHGGHLSGTGVASLGYLI